MMQAVSLTAVSCVMTATMWLAPSVTAHAASQILTPLDPPMAVTAPLEGEKHEDAEDISGIACRPPVEGATRACLVVDDQGRKAQFVTIGNGVLTPGPTVKVIGKRPDDSTLGTPPDSSTCGTVDSKKQDLDGEGVAFAAPSTFYVVGSHGCARKKGTLNLGSFVLARIGASGEVEATTYRVSDALAAIPNLKPYFGASLAENGLNIEGIAVVGDKLYVGLRAPSLDGQAFIVVLPLPSLFASGHERLANAAAAALIPVRLGEKVGIRDLTPLPDGRLLVLAGPAQDQSEVPYSLHIVEPRAGGAAKALGTLAPLTGDERKGKAEAVAILAPDRVLILFDSLPNGGPREYRVDLR